MQVGIYVHLFTELMCSLSSETSDEYFLLPSRDSLDLIVTNASGEISRHHQHLNSEVSYRLACTCWSGTVLKVLDIPAAVASGTDAATQPLTCGPGNHEAV